MANPIPRMRRRFNRPKLSLAAAKTAVTDTELRAPLAGTIAKLDVKPGETAAPGLSIGILADFSGWQIVTDDLTEIKVPNIAEGQPVIVTFDALPELELKGRVDSIGTLFQTNSGDIVYPVKVKLIEVDPRLRWGMTAALEFTK